MSLFLSAFAASECRPRHSLDVRTSGAHSRCNRNRQPRAFDAHPCTALCTRRCRPTTQFESQTSAPCHSSCTGPCARFGNNQRVSNNNWQRMCTPMLVDQSHNTAPLRSNDSRVHSSPKPNHCCAHSPRVSPHQLVQLARAQFRPTAATPNRNEQLSMYKNCVIMAAHNASQ